MFKFFKMLFGETLRDYLPHLPHTIADELDPSSIDDTTEMVLLTGRARDHVGIQKLINKYGAADEMDLLRKLPRQHRRPDWRARLLKFIQRWEGVEPNEPVIRPFVEQQKRLYKTPKHWM